MPLTHVSLNTIRYHRPRITEELRREKKSKPDYTVIEVGGAANGFPPDVVDAVVDLFPLDQASNAKLFQGNIDDWETWEPVFQHVKNKGKFDFSICSHTLEDISNPMSLLKILQKISKAGLMVFPSKYVEFSKPFESDGYRGYWHHRHILSVKNGGITVVPKFCWVEAPILKNALDSIAQKRRTVYHSFVSEVTILWEESFEYSFVTDKYFRPGGSFTTDSAEWLKCIGEDDLDALPLLSEE